MWREWRLRFIWLSIGSLIGRLLPYGILIWMGRHLDPLSFATIGVVFAWTTVAASLTTGGLANVAAQRLAGTENSRDAQRLILRFARIGIVLSGLLVGAVLIVGSGSVLDFFGQSIDANAVEPALISGATWSLVMLAVAMLNGIHKARKAASVLSLGGVLQGVGLALGLWVSNGQLNGILWGLALGNTFALAFALWQVYALSLFKDNLLQSLPYTPVAPLGTSIVWATLATASVTPVTFAASTFISHGSDGALQLAQFHALEQLHQLATYLPNVMAVAMLPLLSRQIMRDDGSSVRSAVKVCWLLAAIGLALVLPLAWNPIWLHRLVGNPALIDVVATRSMLLHIALYPSLSILGGTLLARGLFGLATFLNIGWAAVLLFITWYRREEGAESVQTARLVASSLLISFLTIYLWISGGASGHSRR